MSRLFPHPPYAEDQPLSHTILYTHVLTRGIQAGTLIGAGISVPIYFYSTSRFSKTAPQPILPTLLKSSGRGALIMTALMAIAVPARMYGRSDIEWQDRSWRLLENKGQLECDDWTYAGMGLSVLGAVALRQRPMVAVGTVGLGSVVGMAGYMGWRYGVRGGRFEEKEEVVV